MEVEEYIFGEILLEMPMISMYENVAKTRLDGAEYQVLMFDATSVNLDDL